MQPVQPVSHYTFTKTSGKGYKKHKKILIIGDSIAIFDLIALKARY